MKKILLYLVSISTLVCVFLGLLSIWGFLNDDIQWKALATIGFIAMGGGIVLKFLDVFGDKIKK